MRISDVFAMGGDYGNSGGYRNSGAYQNFDEACYGSYPYCVRSYDSPDKYNDPRSHRRGLAAILGSFRN
jgi:hypothetical protein